MQVVSSKKKILVVDDSKVSRSMIKAELEKGGYEVTLAECGGEALKLVQECLPDLITLDVEMPGLDGFDTCRLLREFEVQKLGSKNSVATTFIPVLFLTAKDNYQARTKGFNAGAKEFINKGNIKEDLLVVVDDILKSSKNLEGLHAMVVDPSRTARGITVSHLASTGVSVHEFSSGTEAFEFLKDNKNEIDILISEVALEGMNGTMLCEKARKELKLNLPMIIVTSDVDRSKMLRFFQAGATDYLVKPYLKEEFLTRLNSHLEIRIMFRDLEKKNSELQNINSLKDKFLSVCTHDLRSPLNAILGFTGLLKDELEIDEEYEGFLDKIEQSGENLLTLIEELLDFTRLRTDGAMDNREELDLVSLCQQTVKELEMVALKKKVTIDLICDSSEGMLVCGSETGIRRIISNLGSNGIKFTPEGGKIEFRLANVQNQILLKIIDTGIGIPEKNIATMFSDNFNLNRAGTDGEKSTGIGLKIVKEIADQHGLSINVSSQEGKGTTFTVEFTPIKTTKLISA